MRSENSDTAPLCPIAVIGIGCRFADDIDRPSRLWEVIARGKQLWSPVPRERWSDAAFHNPHADMHGMMNHRGGHFIKRDLSAFDAGFFEIGAQESQAMDPQQRLLLETSYEALENAGLPLDKVKGSNTGVYVAAFAHDYEHMTHKDDLTFAKYYANGLGSAFFSNRLSFFYDFHGPSLSVETACSGSLVALHLAAESLRSGESDMGMVAGSNLMLEPDMMEGMSLLHITNSEGRSYSFDARGAGYGRGEGVAAIIIKRLEDAVEAGDPIHAIIRGTGVNSDGYTRAGISVPSSSAQQALIRSVYKKARIDPRDTLYFEAHGTGTAVGDAAEVNAIASVFRPKIPHQTEEKNIFLPLYIGSVKANIGHTEACAGLAGLIKAILVLHHEMIPPVADLRSLKDGMLPPGSNIEVSVLGLQSAFKILQEGSK
ncbi:hypothetical protein N0V93_008332 [Gnomoniopsis smithogilvyi]|uniref:Ketosynthase family 3 (KS3) domain-containing protein n=1 Tax=Gnomoniopsis smithogilvyi TaxID=1191159 RepID=A0A9W8YMR1_9PEZI|nr:hypothetical protein N0V93_008332 [Gnomoniopsis smithogilvyi]